MIVKLLTSTQTLHDMEYNAALAALTCHANTDKEFVPSEVLTRIIKSGHESILEHINLTYSIQGLSRACLQELARHRHISLSVESTRHTLKKSIGSPDKLGHLYDTVPQKFHETLRETLRFTFTTSELSNDELKYYLPEFWPTNLILTTNIRELRHILNLRTAPEALKEFRVLAHSMFEVVPDEYKYLLKDCVREEDEHDIQP